MLSIDPDTICDNFIKSQLMMKAAVTTLLTVTKNFFVRGSILVLRIIEISNVRQIIVGID